MLYYNNVDLFVTRELKNLFIYFRRYQSCSLRHAWEYFCFHKYFNSCSRLYVRANYFSWQLRDHTFKFTLTAHSHILVCTTVTGVFSLISQDFSEFLTDRQAMPACFLRTKHGIFSTVVYTYHSSCRLSTQLDRYFTVNHSLVL